MHPEDRVLVGVINRRKDFDIAREQGWYRIPEGKAPKGLEAEYLAFFFSGKDFGKQSGGIHYFARRTEGKGLELATRAQLLPDEADHKRAQERYHVLSIENIQVKPQPILNPSKRRFAFIYTTWDRFVQARTLDDLYSKADYLVDRVFYFLEDIGYRPLRRWQFEPGYPVQAAQVRVLCEQGEVVASAYSDDGILITDDLNETVEKIRQEIDIKGGPLMLPIPLE
jgi:hypothetical protein